MDEKRIESIRRLSVSLRDDYEQQIIYGTPLPKLDDFCWYCQSYKKRWELQMVKPEPGMFCEKTSCKTCIKKHGLEVSNSLEAMEYEAQTLAIIQIRGMNEKILFEDED